MWIGIAALNLALAVMVGAFGAHGLKKIASEQQLAWWQTAPDPMWYFTILWLFICNGIRLATYLGRNYTYWGFTDDSWLACIGLASI